jgi:hypothetical protein
MNNLNNLSEFVRKKKERKKKVLPPVNHSPGPLNKAEMLVTNQITCI